MSTWTAWTPSANDSKRWNSRPAITATDPSPQAHTHTVARQLRWWRGLACGALVLSLLSLTLPSGKAVDAQSRPLAEHLSALQDTLTILQDKLQHVTVVANQDALPEVVITGANLRIVNGLGSTYCSSPAGPGDSRLPERAG